MQKYYNWGTNNFANENYEKTTTYYQRYLVIAEFLLSELGEEHLSEKIQDVQGKLDQIDLTLAALRNIPTPPPTPTPSPTATPVPTQLPISLPTPTPLPTRSPTPPQIIATLPTQSPTPPVMTSTPTQQPTTTPEPAFSEMVDVGNLRSGDVYAVIIGIGDYADKRLNLRYTDDDARDLYDLLTDPNYGGVPEDNIRLLVDKDATARISKERLANGW